MRKLHYTFVLFYIGVVCTSFSLSAQKHTKDNPISQFGYHFKSKNQSFARVPIEVLSNLIVVKLNIDNSDTLNFILDTGVSSTFITDNAVANRLGFDYVRQVQISGAGEGIPLKANVTVGHTIQIKDVIAKNQNLVVLNEDILKLSEYMGVPIHGIFGHDLFDAFVVTIDFESKNLLLVKPSKFKFRKSLGEKFPIVVTQSKPYTEAFTLADENDSKPLKLVIDTGAGHALMLNATNQHDNINLPDKYIRANLGRGLNGEINGVIGRVKKVKMGEVEIEDVLASFPDSISFSMKFPPTDYDRQGSIGCELLRRFKVTFNYNEGYIALKPNKVRMKETFEHDMSGLEIRAKGAAFDKFVIENVIEESPAARAGLQKGDEIMFFNNQSIKNLTISEIYKQLSKKEGKEVELFVRRNSEIRFFYFNLKRFI